MADDWRIRIEVEDEHGRLLERLGVELDDEAREIARELERHRLAVSRDGDTIFVYAASGSEAEQAQAVIGSVLATLGLRAQTSRIEHWLEDEERWDDEPPGESWEEEELDRGYAPWEVRVRCASRQEAKALAEQLEGEGYRPRAPLRPHHRRDGLEGGRRRARRTAARQRRDRAARSSGRSLPATRSPSSAASASRSTARPDD